MGQPKYDVFISYSSKDKVIADSVCQNLEDNGLSCWIAPRNVCPGERYATEIVNGIKSCRTMVLVYSKNSNKSPHVANEVDLAFNNDITIIPFLVDNTPMNDEFSYFLARKHWMVAYPNYKEHLNELATSAKNIIDNKPLPLNLDDDSGHENKLFAAIVNFFRKAGWKSLASLLIKWKKQIIIGAIALSILFVIIALFCVSRSHRTIDTVSDSCLAQDSVSAQNKDCLQLLAHRLDSINPSELGVLSDNVYYYKKKKSYFFIDSLGNDIAGGVAFDTFKLVSNVIVTGFCKEDKKNTENALSASGQTKSNSAVQAKKGKTSDQTKRSTTVKDNRDKNGNSVRQISKYGIISLEGKVLLPCEYKKIEHLASGVHVYYMDSLCGWTTDTSFVRSAVFKSITNGGIDNLLLCKNYVDGCWEFYSIDGEKKLPNTSDTKFYEAGSFKNGYAWVKTTLKNAPVFIDRNGNKVWSPVDAGYDRCTGFWEEYATVTKSVGKVEKEGMIDKNFKEILPCIYECVYIYDVGKNAAEVKFDGKWHVVSFDGNILASSQEIEVEGEFFKVKREDKSNKNEKKWQLYVRNKAIPKSFSYVYIRKNGLYAEAKDENGAYIVIPNGSISKPYKYVYSYDETGRVIKVEDFNHKYGFVDLNLNVLVDCKYSSLGILRSGLIYAKTDSLYGYINRYGEWKLSPIYDNAFDFSEGYAIVKYKGEFGVIKTNGTFVIPHEYDKIERKYNDLFVVCKDDKYGVFDVSKNMMVVPCEYCNTFKHISHNRFPVLLNGKWGIFSSNGKSTFDYSLNSGNEQLVGDTNGNVGIIRKMIGIQKPESGIQKKPESGIQKKPESGILKGEMEK